VRTTFAVGLDDPFALAIDTADNLFVVDGGNIDKFTPEGVRTTFAVGLDDPFALVIDTADNVFVTDSLDIAPPGHAHIYKFTPDGARTTFASGLLAPTGLAFDSTHNLFVVDEGDLDGLGAAIYKFTSGGNRTTFASPFLCIGPGLAINDANNLFVPDWCTGDIHMFTPTGRRSTFVSGSTHDTGLFLAFQPTHPVASNDIFDGSPLGSGWFYSSWFGTYNSNSYPWIYHNELGFMYVFGSDSNNIWLYSPNLGFLWTTSIIYPFLWSDRDQAWLWYERGTSNPLWFYNVNLDQWVNGT
jgi:hypothetical protein